MQEKIEIGFQAFAADGGAALHHCQRAHTAKLMDQAIGGKKRAVADGYVTAEAASRDYGAV